MFNKIMIPIDLEHQDTVAKAVDIACDMAKKHNAELYFVSVSGMLPSSVASTTGEYEQKLEAFTEHKAEKYGITAHTVNLHSVDVAAEVDAKLLHAVEEIKADLVIMASHEPHVIDHIFGTHGGHMATHAKTSVFIVR